MEIDPPLWRRPAWVLLAVLWITLPLTVGSTLPTLLHGSRNAEHVIAWGLTGLAYGIGVVGLFHLTAAGITILRIGAGALVLWIGGLGVVSLRPLWGGAVLGLTLLLLALSWSEPLAQASADQSAVPGERRFALALTPGLRWLLGPLTGAVAASGVIGPLLLLTRPRPGWIAWALCALGLLVAIGLGSASIRLARRWLIVVPAGAVLHDPVLLDDTIRLAPHEIRSVALTAPGWRPRRREPDALDLTGGARRALWVGLVRPVAPPRTTPGVRRPGALVDHIFCSPSRRGEAAAALQAKGYRISEPLGAP
jgi:hypothetical protein